MWKIDKIEQAKVTEQVAFDRLLREEKKNCMKNIRDCLQNAIQK